MINTQSGDIVIVHSHNFTARGIQFFMNLWRWLHLDFKPFYKEIANHDAIGYKTGFVEEAIKEGTKINNVNTAYPQGCNKTVKVYRYNFTTEQIKAVEQMCIMLKDTPYQFSNLLVYPLYILTFGLVWLGKKGSDSFNKEYCSELISTIIYYATNPLIANDGLDRTTHKYFMKFWSSSPYKVQKWCEEYCQLISIDEL